MGSHCRELFQCIGAIDGKHISIVCPKNTVTEYHNYKDFFSVILLALVDADYKFINVVTGAQGKCGDSGVFSDSELYKRLVSGNLNLPEDRYLPGDEMDLNKAKMPYVIVGDDAFPLKKNIMKPYAKRGLSEGRRIFNYRLSRARRCSENAFGIFAQSFRVFFTKINLDPAVVEWIILACCGLHNVLRTLSRDSYTPSSFVDTVSDDGTIIDGQWRDNAESPHMLPLKSLRAKAEYSAEEVRDNFKEYFQLRGSVPWQYGHVYAS